MFLVILCSITQRKCRLCSVEKAKVGVSYYGHKMVGYRPTHELTHTSKDACHDVNMIL